jgi:WS/DGAT/MGAT family acyltransferase
MSQSGEEGEAVSPWVPRPAPSGARLLAGELLHRFLLPLSLLRTAARAGAEPRTALAGLGSLLRAGIFSTSETPFNGDLGPHRRFDWTRLDLAAVQEVKRACGGKLNDVVLAVVAGAMRRYFKARRVRLRGSDLRVIVPVDTRSRPEDAALANRVSAWFVTLPVSERDPLRRFARIRAQTRRRKHARAELVIDLFHRFADWAGSSSLTALGASGVSWLRPYNLIVTNIPGPHFPLYMLGSTLREFVPALPLFANQGLAVTAMSYRGRVYFGLTGDRDVLGDLPEFADAIEASFEELRAAAEQRP